MKHVSELNNNQLLELLTDLDEKDFKLSSKKKTWGSRKVEFSYHKAVYQGSLNTFIRKLSDLRPNISKEKQDKFNAAIKKLKKINKETSKEFETGNLAGKAFRFVLHKIRQLFGEKVPFKNRKIAFQELPFKKTSAKKADKVKSKEPQLAPQKNKAEDLQELLDLSELFEKNICKMPTQNNKLATLASKNKNYAKEIVDHAKAAAPIFSSATKQLMSDFLEMKKKEGTGVEKTVYQNLNIEGLIDRLLAKRPLDFLNSSDDHLLRDGTSGKGCFEQVGAEHEQPPYLLKDYLSYDEIQLSALMGLSTPTHFINAGSRTNRGTVEKEGSFEEKGVYIGLVGARFERKEQMEWQHMLVTQTQNTSEKGYGKGGSASGKQNIWAKFYGLDHFPSYEEAKQDKTGRFLKVGDAFLDTLVYKKRLAAVIEPFLAKADQAGKERGQQVYVHAVGLGLGAWELTPAQTKLQVEVYKEILSQKSFKKISDIDFSWFSGFEKSVKKFGDGDTFKKIRIHFSKRNPADKLENENKGKLIVAQYAWDGNSFPGNEYWSGALSASGDPAAASCSNISELGNPYINPYLKGKKAEFF